MLHIAAGLSDGVAISSTPRDAGYGSLSYAPTIRVKVACRLPIRLEFLLECTADRLRTTAHVGPV